MRRLRIWFAAVVLFLALPPAAAASPPYYGYQYGSNDVVPAPLPYLPVKAVYGWEDDPENAFQAPEDLYVSSDGMIYVADTGNDRIVILDRHLQVKRVIDSFLNGGKEDRFQQPQGVFVDGAGHLYVADTQNQRIVELDAGGRFVREIGAPESDVLRDDFQFIPKKIAVDSAGRIFVVAQGVYEGLMEFNSKGAFTGFMGTHPVSFNLADFFWKSIATDAQRAQMELYIPIEFNNVYIDKEQFLFVTTAENRISSDMVKRLNPSGVDVLRQDGPIPVVGDWKITTTGSYQGSSAMVAAAVNEDLIYLVLDAKRGRIFTYDYDGNLLFHFGQVGNKLGTFQSPVDVDWLGRNVVVLDRAKHRITLFEPTRYGSLVLDAASAYFNGKEETAAALWREVSRLNNNLEIAHIGVGKAELEQGHYQAAMESFRLGESRRNYSNAFKSFRKVWMWDHFTFLFFGFFALIAALVLSRRLLPKTDPDDYGPIRTAFRTAVRPFSMFWALKYEGKGKLWMSLAIVALAAFFSVLRQFYAGFIVNSNPIASLNSLKEFLMIIIPFLTWCLANWSLTTLMDGEGTFKDIVIAAGYAMLPLLLMNALLIPFSWIITQEEAAFYFLLQSVAMLWFIWLLFVGTMTVHQYTPLKTAVTLVLTLVVVGIIIFLALLVFSLIQQLFGLVTSVYQELLLRI